MAECEDPGANWSLVDGDCNDNSNGESPGGTEVCGDGLDNDCVGGDESCGTDYSDIWTLYQPGTNNILTVQNSTCTSTFVFSFSVVRIVDTAPSIEIIAGNNTDLRVNGCEFPGLLCSNNGMFGTLDLGPPDLFNAQDAIEPLLGSGWAELYYWRGTDGSSASTSFAEFTDENTFVGTFIAEYEPRSIAPPADCTREVWQVEGRRN